MRMHQSPRLFSITSRNGATINSIYSFSLGDRKQKLHTRPRNIKVKERHLWAPNILNRFFFSCCFRVLHQIYMFVLLAFISISNRYIYRKLCSFFLHRTFAKYIMHVDVMFFCFFRLQNSFSILILFSTKELQFVIVIYFEI